MLSLEFLALECQMNDIFKFSVGKSLSSNALGQLMGLLPSWASPTCYSILFCWQMLFSSEEEIRCIFDNI